MDEEALKKHRKDVILIMRTRLLKAYHMQKPNLEVQMGHEISFEDWLCVQMTMVATLGNPPPEDWKSWL